VFCCVWVGTIGGVSQGGELDPGMRGKLSNFAPDEAIAAIAGRQHGVVGRQQLIAAGLRAGAIERRIRAGRLHPLYRGVYAVGHRVVSERGRWMAATLATGGVLSHRSAGALWGIRPWSGRIEITNCVEEEPTTRPPPSPSRSRRRRDHDHDGIPVTTPARTQLDLAGVLQRHQLQQTINEAERLRLDGPHDLTRRHPTKRGTRSLRTLAPPTHTRTDLEARFHTFLNDRRFPTPQTNVLIEGEEVDCVWPDRKLVELDSYEPREVRAGSATRSQAHRRRLDGDPHHLAGPG